MRREPRTSRRTVLTATGTLSLFGITGVVAGGSSSTVANAPVPENADANTYPTMGTDSDAPTATIYGNYKCPYTRDFVFGNLEAIVEEFVEPGRLNLEFYNLAYEPGDTSEYYISSSDPRLAAVGVGVWNEDPDNYWGFHRETFADMPSGTVDYDELEERVRSAGVSNAEAIVDRARAGEYDDEIERVATTAADDGVAFTPTMELAGDTTAPHHERDAILDWIERRLGDDDEEQDSDDEEQDSETGDSVDAEEGTEDEAETEDDPDEEDEATDDSDGESEDDEFVWVTEPAESDSGGETGIGTEDDC
ncbi:DsbA family protein [Halosolutus halophilus]|uniref:DsbA family protein n=1 Tax=Halosolutus halophilus TaxID=1552990 RepID=UPI002234F026|nr:DsbA family protein [Halosolutus halophilus]